MDENIFEPIVVDTKDVIKELKAVASTYKVPLANVDFHLLETSIFFRTNANEEWEKLVENKKQLFETDEFFLHEGLQIASEYKIEIFYNNLQDQLNFPTISLGANKTLTNIVATIQKISDVDFNSAFEKKLAQEINKKKIKAGVLVGIRQKDMLKEIRQLSSSVQVNGMIEQNVTFIVSEGVKPVLSVDDDLIFHYQKKMKKKDEQGRINYARRGYILPVYENEIVIEYIKPQMGIAGRDCRGKYIPVKQPITKNNQQIHVSEFINIQEDDESVKYIATKEGYVVEEKGLYTIKDQMDVDEISFKTTGSIEAGIDSNVTINIKENDIFKDAIGAGMSVETSILNVQGSVGNNASIVAKKVNIGGQTHKSSSINANEVDIAVHRGEVNANSVHVQRLEGGKIVADIAKVEVAIGGSIIAREIYIDKLMSNVNLITSELIDLKHVQGSNNKILVDPARIKDLQSIITDLSEQIQKKQKELVAFPKQLEYKKEIIENSKEAIGQIKDRLLELKAKNIKAPLNLMKKIKDYQQLINDYNALLHEFKNIKDEIKLLKEQVQEHQSKIFSSKIINHSTWTEFNEIRFKLMYPPVEVVHNTRDNEIAREISLKKISDEDFEILRSSEYKK